MKHDDILNIAKLYTEAADSYRPSRQVPKRPWDALFSDEQPTDNQDKESEPIEYTISTETYSSRNGGKWAAVTLYLSSDDLRLEAPTGISVRDHLEYILEEEIEKIAAYNKMKAINSPNAFDGQLSRHSDNSDY